MIHIEQTQHLNLPLPHPANTLETDVFRLRSAIEQIDDALRDLGDSIESKGTELTDSIESKGTELSDGITTKIQTLTQSVEAKMSALTAEFKQAEQDMINQLAQSQAALETAMNALRDNVESAVAAIPDLIPTDPIGNIILTSASEEQLAPDYVPLDGKLRLRSEYPTLAELVGDVQAFSPDAIETVIPNPNHVSMDLGATDFRHKAIAVGDVIFSAFNCRHSATGGIRVFIARSFDKGETWAFLNSPTTAKNCRLCFFEHFGAERLLLGVVEVNSAHHYFLTFYWSDDFGNTWSQFSLTNPTNAHLNLFSVSCDLEMHAEGQRFIYISVARRTDNLGSAQLHAYDVVMKRITNISHDPGFPYGIVFGRRIDNNKSILYYTANNAGYSRDITDAPSATSNPTIGAVETRQAWMDARALFSLADATSDTAWRNAGAISRRHGDVCYHKLRNTLVCFAIDLPPNNSSSIRQEAMFNSASASLGDGVDNCFKRGYGETIVALTIDPVTGGLQSQELKHKASRFMASIPAQTVQTPAAAAARMRYVTELAPTEHRNFVLAAQNMFITSSGWSAAHMANYYAETPSTFNPDTTADWFYDNATGDMIGVKVEGRNGVSSIVVHRRPLAADYSEYVQTPNLPGMAIKVTP